MQAREGSAEVVVGIHWEEEGGTASKITRPRASGYLDVYVDGVVISAGELGGRVRAGRFHVGDVRRAQTRRRKIGIGVEGQVDSQTRGRPD